MKRAIKFLLLGYVAVPAALLAQPVAPSNAPEGKKNTYDFATALQDAKNNDPRLKAASQAVTAQAAVADTTKMAVLPNLSVGAYVGQYTQKKYQQLANYLTIFNQRAQFGSQPGLVTVSGTLQQANLSANQNLITFGRQQANEGIGNSQLRLARWQEQQVINQITLDVANSYIGCATAGLVANTKELYLASLQGIYDEVKKKYDLNAATITDLNLVAINYRDSANDLLLQKQQVATACKKLLRLTAKELDVQEFLPRLSLADLDQYDKLIPNNFDDVKNRILARDPALGLAIENLVLSQKRKELAAANLMPTASWNAKVEQLQTPGASSRNGVTPSASINNQSVTISVNYQQNIVQNIFQLSADNHRVASQSYLADNQLQATTNQILNLWQNYQAGKKSMPFMVQSLNETSLAMDGVAKMYDRGAARLSVLLQKRQEFLSTILQYHQLHESKLLTSLTLLSFLGAWS